MRVSESELREIQQRLGQPLAAPLPKRTRTVRLYRSKAEAAWADRLDARQRAGEIKRWRYETVTLKLGPDCRYTPDFLVIPWGWPIMRMELHEVKGKHVWDRALDKVRAAAGAFPEFRFVLARLVGTTWEEREISA